MSTDKLFTGQRNMAGLGIYHYQSRFPRSAPEAERRGYSPKLGRFLSTDSLVPNPFNPQEYNRYSYVRNNPANYVDSSGHAPSDPNRPIRSGISDPPRRASGSKPSLGTGSGSNSSRGGGGDNTDGCNPGDTCVGLTTTELLCDYVISDCAAIATGLGATGTVLDGIALAINAPFGAAATASVATALAGDPAGLVAYGTVYKAYQFAAPFSNAFGWLGFAAWTAQGIVTGDTQIGVGAIYGSDRSLKQISVSGSLSQDTIFSGLNDYLALKIKEPMVATIWSAVGVGYDLFRNPLASPTPPPLYLPTVLQPNGSVSYNFQTGVLSGNFAWSPSGP